MWSIDGWLERSARGPPSQCLLEQIPELRPTYGEREMPLPASDGDVAHLRLRARTGKQNHGATIARRRRRAHFSAVTVAVDESDHGLDARNGGGRVLGRRREDWPESGDIDEGAEEGSGHGIPSDDEYSGFDQRRPAGEAEAKANFAMPKPRGLRGGRSTRWRCTAYHLWASTICLRLVRQQSLLDHSRFSVDSSEPAAPAG